MSFAEDFTFTRGTAATRINEAGLIVGVDFSATSVTFGTGTKAFTLAADANVNRDWRVGESVIAVSQAAPLGDMTGTVVSYVPSTQVLTLDVTVNTGTGTGTNWRLGSLDMRRDAEGVVREPLRSNLLLRSEEFDNASWLKLGLVTVTPNTSIAPNGSLAVDTVNIPAGANTGLRQDVGVSAIQYRFTVWARAVGSPMTLRLAAFNVTPASINLLSLPVGVLTQYTVNFSFTAASTAQFRIDANDAGGILEIWGAQLEAGSSPTSYIPTTTVAVTRNADTFTFSPAAIAKFRQGQGAVVIEANATDAGTAQRAALRLTGPSGEIRIGKQGVATSANFTKMAEGGEVQLLGNATQGVTNNGLDYTLFNPINTATGLAIGAFGMPAVTYDGTSNFGFLSSGNAESTVNQTFTTADVKGWGGTVLNGAHHNGSRFLIATGTAGVVGISTDGLSYRRVNTPVITQPCNEVTSGLVGGTLRNVIVGNAGFIATSDDNGETWVSRVSGTALSINGATRSTTHFVAAISSTNAALNLIRSNDALSWVSVANSGVTQNLIGIHANGATLVAVGNTGAITVSLDNGATWAASPSSGVVTTQALRGVHYNASANLWVAVGNAGTIITATDPAGTWTLQTIGTTQNLNEVSYFNGLWVVVGNNQNVFTSPNAVTWTARTGITSNFFGIASSGSRLIITGTAGGFASSEDALTYTSRTNNNATLNGIAFGAGVYVSVGNAVNGSGYIATIDGAGTVTRRVSGTTQSLLNAKYLRGAHYAVGNASILSRAVDGITWATQTIGGTAFNIQEIADSGSLMIAVGAGGRYSTSADGLSFAASALNGQTTQQLNGIDFANGLFVVVGNAGVILTTTNGTTYTLRTSGTTQNLTSIMYSQRDQRWYAAGNAGTLLYSEDNGVTWAPVNNAGFGAVQNTTLQASKLLPVWKQGRNTMAMSYKANEVIVGLNGATTTDTSNTIPSITAGVLGETFNGYIKSVKFQPNPLTAAEVKAITGVLA